MLKSPNQIFIFYQIKLNIKTSTEEVLSGGVIVIFVSGKVIASKFMSELGDLGKRLQQRLHGFGKFRIVDFAVGSLKVKT